MTLYTDLIAALDAACRKANATGEAQCLTPGYAGIGYRIYNAAFARRYPQKYRVLEVCRPQEVAA